MLLYADRSHRVCIKKKTKKNIIVIEQGDKRKGIFTENLRRRGGLLTEALQGWPTFLLIGEHQRERGK